MKSYTKYSKETRVRDSTISDCSDSGLDEILHKIFKRITIRMIIKFTEDVSKHQSEFKENVNKHQGRGRGRAGGGE
jgi:hypothetical protein